MLKRLENCRSGVWSVKRDESLDEFLGLTNDVAFKVFFKENTQLLNSLLEDFLPLPKNSRVVKVDVLNPEIESDELKKVGGEEGKKFILDLKVAFERSDTEEKQPEIANVEMQTTSEIHFADRLLAYSARLYSRQLKAGDSYKSLAPVYSLIFMSKNLRQFEEIKDEYYHICTIRRATKPDLILSRGMCFVIVELEKFKKKIEELKGQREDWSYLLKNSGNMNKKEYEILQNKGGIMAEAVKSLWNMSKEEGLREYLEAVEKKEMDRISDLESAREDGLKRGERKKAREIARELLAAGTDYKFIAKITGLALEEIEKLKQEG